jgi:hypothetical protein
MARMGRFIGTNMSIVPFRLQICTTGASLLQRLHALGLASLMLVSVSGQESPAGIDVRVAVAPTPLKGSDGRTHLAYELVVSDIPTPGARIDRVEVFADSDSKPLLTYAGSDLDGRVMRPEAERSVRYGRAIPGGTTALIHVWVTLEVDQPVPRTLRHSVQVASEGGHPVVAPDARESVRSAPPIRVGAPFRAGTWLAHNGPGEHRSPHWGSALVQGRTARIPQRYAIDFIGIDDNGRAVRGDIQKSSNADWTGFGHEILAVLDGTVYAARDGVADNKPLAELPPPASPSAADSYGNYVIVRAGAGTFVHYAHLQLNSVAVKAGEIVRRGQVIGRLGNSGNTNGAHLHFNITDGPAPEAAQGLPFVFDTVDTRGSTTVDIAVGEAPSASPSPVAITRQQRILPLDGAVVHFR